MASSEWINIPAYHCGQHYMTSLYQPSPGACVIGIRDWALKLSRHRRLCEKLPSPLFHVITMPWNAYTSHTSGPPLHLQLSPTYPPATLWSIEPAGPASSPSRNPICLDPLDIPSVLWSRGFKICLCSCRELRYPSFLFSGCLGADSVWKSPLIYTQQLQRREVLLIGCSNIDVALPNFTCRGTWSICWCI